MDQSLQDNLFEKYPNLFSNKDKGIQVSSMAWGVDCDNGWYDLIASVCYTIKKHEESIEAKKKYRQKQDENIGESEYSSVKFDQIKQKFGGLRIYFSGGDDYIHGVVSLAEEMSYKLCEVCGNKGAPNKGGWITTLCESHRNG